MCPITVSGVCLLETINLGVLHVLYKRVYIPGLSRNVHPPDNR
ncbi:hypothetical protein EGR_10499 [Echinococcus granulosus]|uniref:Uncharacterized protein n=1 Tax=Echinococcus granulosus TaxID=6210 RepID=W6U8A8_ECHGR|nr:hypothetical protein EGR_10499 [Echinococcus granulosus]EUB54647.1 hypothetical protein EGR_10499 [Echinococcus granulosus]